MVDVGRAQRLANHGLRPARAAGFFRWPLRTCRLASIFTGALCITVLGSS
jgi:hypothetical protein